MKVAVTAMAESLDAAIDPRFGRCSYFVFVDPDTLESESMSNPAAGAMGGAGPQAAQAVADKGIKVVLTGNVGPNAFQALNAAGIKVITGVTGTVKEAVEKYKSGTLGETKGPTVPPHSGMGKV